MKWLFSLFSISMVFLGQVSQTYADDFISPKGFALKYPRGWRPASQKEFDIITSKAAEKSKDLSAVFYGPHHKGFPDSLTVLVIPGTLTIDENHEKELIEKMQQLAGKRTANSKIKIIEVNGIKAISMASETEDKNIGETLRQWQFQIPGKEHIYVFTFATLKSSWTDEWPMFKEIIDSVRIDVPSTLAQNPAEIEPYLSRRASFKTALLKGGPSPQKWTDDPLPQGVKSIEYQSEGRMLKAWLFIPKLGEKEKRPALVYLHGGFAFGKDDFVDCHVFTEARFIVLCPTFRGENGNLGNFEMMFGEVDDAAAAINWLASQKNVDSKNIFVFGHSSGGVMAAMLSLYDKLPVSHTGSAGGLYGPDIFDLLSKNVPFDLSDNQERQMRVLIGNIKFMKRPHFAFIGTEDIHMKKEIAKQEATDTHAPLTITEIPGDHSSTLDPAMQKYLEIILQKTGRSGS
jgi:acetyl esterase/lipase